MVGFAEIFDFQLLAFHWSLNHGKRRQYTTSFFSASSGSMEDVSDPPFRAVCKDHGADLMYTEFISSEGLIRNAIKSRQKLDIFEYERPVGIQIFGGDEESLAMAAKIVDVTNHLSTHC